MSGRIGQASRWTLAAAVAAALGFGAAQAVAAPAAPSPHSPRVCAGPACDLLCRQLDYARGQCVEGVCRCFTQ
ncbi:hypothetical protein [Longimicrobium sp.]|uniref:hypothetical protein n=1 Tax=Longimicrobium sp. TaxID=2029185 RepID=UPI002B6A3020|nr:hypothetical protein [Longimicrobium sp.]HSU15323.1 hypothetical protein [Longimicrobium sp.]